MQAITMDNSKIMTMKTLVVENDDEIRKILEETLRSRGHEVATCADAHRAWEAYQREAYPLVFLGWELPGMAGLELCQQIREHSEAEFSVVVMVDANGQKDFQAAIDAGADDYLIEPFNAQVLNLRLAVAERRVKQLFQQKRMIEACLQLQKLSAIGQLASCTTHDFNNALAVVLSRIERLKDFVQQPEAQRDVDMIEKAAMNAAKTMKSFQEFAQEHQGRTISEINLNDMVRNIVEISRPLWKNESELKGLVVETKLDLQASSPVVRGEKAEIQQALIHMLRNSLEAMPDGGQITFSTENVPEGVKVSVSDTGMGMTFWDREHALQPFFTTRPEQGLGFGLSAVDKIVRLHNGKTDLESTQGEGTSVRLTFPAVPGKSGRGTDVCGSCRVLIIDDEEEIVEALAEILSGLGHSVEVAINPLDGLELFLKKSFDLVLTDLGMAGMQGWEVAKAVKEMEPNTGVVLVTGWGTEFDEETVAQNGIDRVIGKPFRREDISDAVSEVLLKRQKV
jgi:DNA-binding response OmpR family regulator